MDQTGKHLYEFGAFQLDAHERVLWRAGQPVQLTPKVFDTLLVLVENSGHIVAKDELMQRLWPDSFVEEGNLAFNISILRKALAESGGEVQFIETVPRRGYRFVAGVRELEDESADLVLEKQTTAHIVIEEMKEEREMESAQESASLAAAVASPATLPVGSLFERLRQWQKPLAIAAIGIGLTAIITFWMASAPAQKTLAVLPFKPLAADASDQYLELGMADALITKLSNIKQIIVRPTSSISKYAAAEEDALAAGRELGVATVLDGSIQHVGDRIRVTVRLVRVSDGAPLRELAERLRAPLFEPGGVLSVLSPATQKQLHDEAKRLATVFQRSSSNVEGRNGYLSLRSHQLRGLDLPRKRECFTAIHNFFLTRSDGTTAAERFFGQKPRSMFAAILASVELAPAPLSPPRKA